MTHRRSDYLDRAGVIATCFFTALFASPGRLPVAELLASIVLAGFCEYLEKGLLPWGLRAMFCLACFVSPGLCFFLPAVAYDAAHRATLPFFAFLALPLAVLAFERGWEASALIASSCAACALLAHRSAAVDWLETARLDSEDEVRALRYALKAQRRELLREQDAGIQTAALKERDRIARDIHDGVGHALSSAILQLAALRAESVKTGVPPSPGSLETLQRSLDRAMTEMRDGVHRLHGESIDIEAYLSSLARSPGVYRVDYSVDVVNQPAADISYAIIAMVKEALTNAARHSGGRTLSVRLKEHPGFYQLLLEDDGKGSNESVERLMARGMGLSGMRDRVEGLGGHFRLSTEDHFRVFASFPKPCGVERGRGQGGAA